MKEAYKIEIITEKRAIGQVIDIIEKYGVTGYSIIADVTGKGKRGIKHGDDLNDVFKNSMIITVCDNTEAENILKELRPFLQRISGICMVTEVKYLVQ